MVYIINLHLRRFGCGTGHLTGLNGYYIAQSDPIAPRGSATARPYYLVNLGLTPGPASISPCTITMDHDAIICFMTDGLTRGTDQDVHVPSVGNQKYPSYNVDVIYL